MRKRMLILLFLGGSLQALAQESASIYQRTISQFGMAYKNQQPDSIYKLFAPSLQAKLLPSLWSGSFVQLLRTAWENFRRPLPKTPINSLWPPQTIPAWTSTWILTAPDISRACA